MSEAAKLCARDLVPAATYFVVAHFHMVMGVSAIFAIFAATYFWFPKMFGRMMSERMGAIHFGLTFIGVYCIFLPMHVLGMQGSPRRYAMLSLDFLQPTVGMHRFVTIAALATGAVQFVFLFNLFWSMFKGTKASANPWNGTSLEWSIDSPAPLMSFQGELPVVCRGAYEYGESPHQTDFVLQSEPAEMNNL